MRTVVFDTLARWFLRAQATLTMSFMAAVPFADRDVRGAIFWVAVAFDVARWALSRFRWPPLALGGALVCCALALCVAAIAGGGASPPLPTPSPDFPGAPLFDPKSGFLSAVEAAGGGGFLFSLAVATFMGQAGVFLMFAGERSAYLRRHWAAERSERPERLGLRGITGLLPLSGLLLFFAVIGIFGIFSGLVLARAPTDPAAALDSVVWRIVTVERFLIPSSIVGATAVVAWVILNGIAFKRELRHEAKSTLSGQRAATA